MANHESQKHHWSLVRAQNNSELSVSQHCSVSTMALNHNVHITLKKGWQLLVNVDMGVAVRGYPLHLKHRHDGNIFDRGKNSVFVLFVSCFVATDRGLCRKMCPLLLLQRRKDLLASDCSSSPT